MRRGTIILILFVVVVAGVIGVSQFLRQQPPLELNIAVDPLAEDWLRAAVTRFNATEPVVNAARRVQFSLTTTGDMVVWRGDHGWTPESHPDAWVPSSSVSVDYASSSNVPLTLIVPSLARTPLVWGGYDSRVAVVTRNGTAPLDWETVAAAAEAEAWSTLGGEPNWQFVKLGFALPDRTMSGLGVLLSGAAYFNENVDLRGGATSNSAFHDWLQPIIASVPNFTTLGNDVAGAMARGPSTVELALLPERSWLANLDGMLGNEGVQLSYPAYQFVYDFPLLLWDTPETTSDQRAAVEAFGDWLLGTAEQAHAVGTGLRPANSEPTTADAIFALAETQGIQLEPDYGQVVIAPSRTESQALIQWFVNQR
jgi:hypothetical protein